MKFRNKAWWIFGIFLLMSSTAGAETEKASRPATKTDLIGTWDMASVKPVLDKKDPVFFPYQRFVFGADSSMKSMVSEEPFTEEWLDKFNKQSREIDYSLSDKGMLTMTWQNRPHSEAAVCAFVLKDVPADVLSKMLPSERRSFPKKGNVALSFLNHEGKIVYRKILIKIA